MSEKPAIFMVDPDWGPMTEYFVKPLQEALPDYTVQHLQCASEALALLEQPNLVKPALVLHEIALPIPEKWAENPPFDLDDGLLTWVALIAEWQKKFKGLTIACLTNYDDSETLLEWRQIKIPMIQKVKDENEKTLQATNRFIGDVKKLLWLHS